MGERGMAVRIRKTAALEEVIAEVFAQSAELDK